MIQWEEGNAMIQWKEGNAMITWEEGNTMIDWEEGNAVLYSSHIIFHGFLLSLSSRMTMGASIFDLSLSRDQHMCSTDSFTSTYFSITVLGITLTLYAWGTEF